MGKKENWEWQMKYSKEKPYFRVGDLVRHKPSLSQGSVIRVIWLDGGGYDYLTMLEGSLVNSREIDLEKV